MHQKERNALQRFKKACMVAMLAAGLLVGAAGGAKAIDFKAQGEWLVGFGVANTSLTKNTRGPNDSQKTKSNTEDDFGASQRVRLQLDAVASEALSGTVFFELGDQAWGKSEDGGALGADGKVVKVKNAYIDWLIPNTDARVRMGLQATAVPNAAGGSAIMDCDSAALVVNYKFNDNVGLTAMWSRPVNDNFGEDYFDENGKKSTEKSNYLDNIDLFMLSVPLSFDGVEVTPWAMYGMRGKNSLRGLEEVNDNEPWETSDGNLGLTLSGLTPGFNYAGSTPLTASTTGKQYGSLFWVGLPVAITMFDPLNIEFDINYGYAEAMGRYDIVKRLNGNDIVRGSTERQGWLAKALIEYKMDWATPGIFGWYASGDDGNVKNGSERMPSLVATGNFTSFMGDGNLGWVNQDYNLSYAGTWGLGLQLRDMSFLEDLSHTFRVAYWGGTNSTSMVKYMKNAYDWNDGTSNYDGPYLTTEDGLVEFNLVNSYKIYENLEMNLELDYLVNCMDNDTWKKAGSRNSSFEKQDMWKAQVVFAYSF